MDLDVKRIRLITFDGDGNEIELWAIATRAAIYPDTTTKLFVGDAHDWTDGMVKYKTNADDWVQPEMMRTHMFIADNWQIIKSGMTLDISAMYAYMVVQWEKEDPEPESEESEIIEDDPEYDHDELSLFQAVTIKTRPAEGAIIVRIWNDTGLKMYDLAIWDMDKGMYVPEDRPYVRNEITPAV